MARKPRIQFSGALYHVIARGNRREPVFNNDADRKRYLEAIQKTRSRFHFTLYAFVLMSNHVHLLVETSGPPLSKVMQSLHTGYTQYFNLKYHKVGHLFQGRYKAVVVDKDAYLLQLIRYIHQNPLRAGMVEHLDDYFWSSHPCYAGRAAYSFLDTSFVLALFGHVQSIAREKYLAFMQESAGELAPRVYEPVLGSEEFTTKIITVHQEQPVPKKAPLIVGLSLPGIATAAAEVLQTPFESIFGASKDSRSSRLRGVVAYVAIECAGISLKEASLYLRRDPSSVSRACHRIRKEVERNQGLVTEILSRTNGRNQLS